MGYQMHQKDSRFFMSKEAHQAALKSIKALAGSETIHDHSGAHFSWVDTPRSQQARHIEDALQAWRWEPDFDEAGNITELEFSGEKLGDDEVLLAAIAPYVAAGSYIEMWGEDFDGWRWVFNGSTVKEVKARIVFDE